MDDKPDGFDYVVVTTTHGRRHQFMALSESATIDCEPSVELDPNHPEVRAALRDLKVEVIPTS